MCGFFGEFGKTLIDKNKFMDLNALSKNRGPDMVGYWSNDTNCQLGFNRLSIIDLTSKGNQPMTTLDNRWTIVMNGEIYNYKLIRQELSSKVSDFISQSDTEVLLKAFSYWGINKTLDKINGIYSIVLFDNLNSKIYLIRDFAGVKPLYYGIVDKTLIFASQYDQIYKHPNFLKKKDPRKNILYDYLRFGYISAPNAFFENTWQVEPGEILSFDLEIQCSKVKYYQFSLDQGFLDETSEETIKEVETTLYNSVFHQLNSDVSVGTFLSGGVDSPLISYYAHQIDPNIKSFTIGSNIKKYDESDAAKYFANEMSLENHQHYFTETDVVKDLDEHFKAFSEPFGDYSSLPTLKVCNMAKSYFSVILGGDGGDELFWGYPRFNNIVNHFNWFSYSPRYRRLAAAISRKCGVKISHGIHIGELEDWMISIHSHNQLNILNKILPELYNSNYMMNLYYSGAKLKTKRQLLNWLRWNEFYGHLQRILIKVDRASMYNSLEVRVPFLDRNILDLVQKINPELGINHHQPKYILKKILKKYFPNIKNPDRKVGFSFDMDYALKNQLREEVYDLLINKDPYPYNTFDRVSLNRYIEDYYSNKNSNCWGVWIIYSLQKWAETFDITR